MSYYRLERDPFRDRAKRSWPRNGLLGHLTNVCELPSASDKSPSHPSRDSESYQAEFSISALA